MPARHLLIISLLAAGFAALTGCTSTPNSPSLVLKTAKAPDVYAQCVYPKWQAHKSGTTLTPGRNQVRLVAKGAVAADQILEVHKASTGSEVSLYLRGPVASTLGVSNLEKSARECL